MKTNYNIELEVKKTRRRRKTEESIVF